MSFVLILDVQKAQAPESEPKDFMIGGVAGCVHSYAVCISLPTVSWGWHSGLGFLHGVSWVVGMEELSYLTAYGGRPAVQRRLERCSLIHEEHLLCTHNSKK